MRLKDSPALLLILTGIFLGLTFPLGKLAVEASISPIVWAWLISTGAGMVLLFIQISSRKKLNLSCEYCKYYLLLSVCSLVLPNILIFYVIPKLGSGFTGILYTLSPIFTLVLSSIWQVRMPNALGIFGSAVGFLGGFVVALGRGEVGQPASLSWILVALCIPLSLAVGNIYRTLAWPKGSNHFELATGTNLAAAILLSIIVVLTSQTSAILDLLLIKELALVQIVVSVAMFSLFFRLQQVGGPTYLSQIGYIAAGVALAFATLFLGERYSTVTWLGAVTIVIGIVFSIVAQRKTRA